jgi:cyclophilin family peptidyl-prolyl cis-trans isomerase
MRIVKSFLLICLLVLYSCGESKYPDLGDGLYAVIETIEGAIVLKLEFTKVPATVGNFVSLAEGTNEKVPDSIKGKPFYNGLNFHRVKSIANGGQNDFMIQSGCPLGTGTGNPGYKFADEFPKDENGDFLFKHDKPGVLSMANSGPGTNGSQFFITLSPQGHLDGKHAIFGSVVKGQDIANTLIVGAVISKLNILRIGREAKNFNAFKALNTSFEQARQKAEELKKIQANTVAQFEEIKKKARELSPEFKIYILEKGEGPKPALETAIRIDYAIYFTDGRLFSTNNKETAKRYDMYDSMKEQQKYYDPFPSTYSMNEQLIQGFKEGLQEMEFGDKAVLFIPYHLGYGEQGMSGIPPKSDLIFELELFPPN